MIESWRGALQQGEAAWLAWLPVAGAGSGGASLGCAGNPAAWRSVANQGRSSKPCQAFIGADIVTVSREAVSDGASLCSDAEHESSCAPTIPSQISKPIAASVITNQKYFT